MNNKYGKGSVPRIMESDVNSVFSDSIRQYEFCPHTHTHTHTHTHPHTHTHTHTLARLTEPWPRSHAPPRILYLHRHHLYKRRSSCRESAAESQLQRRPVL